MTISPPLPPGCMSTVWGDDERFVNTYFKDFKDQLVYSTFDWGIRDKDGYYFILGRTDDVINVAATASAPARSRKRSTCIRTSPNAPWSAVSIRSRARCRSLLQYSRSREADFRRRGHATVDKQLGAIARPKAVHFVTLLPKTRSGKTLRRSIQALAEGRDRATSPPSKIPTHWSRSDRP